MAKIKELACVVVMLEDVAVLRPILCVPFAKELTPLKVVAPIAALSVDPKVTTTFAVPTGGFTIVK